MESENSFDIPIIYGKIPARHEKEFIEMSNYESGKAEAEALKVKGPFQEPWLNVVNAYEPVSMPGFDKLLAVEDLRRRIRGKVIDLAAGSCWLTGKVSLLPEVEEVYAVDLSENFLKTAGVRCMKSLQAKLEKVRLTVSDFTYLPFESGMADCVLIFGALHHSLSPIKTLQEAARCLKPGGSMMILEHPTAAINIRQARKRSLSLSEHASEIAYTREELEYVMQAAQIGPLKVYTFDILTRPGFRSWVRKLLRHWGVEHLILRGTYLFLIEKPGKGPI